MATLYNTDGTVEEVFPEGEHFTLQELQEHVEGYIEVVHLRDGRLMWINEEGKLWGFALNKQATELWGSPHDVIVGPALVTTYEEAGE